MDRWFFECDPGQAIFVAFQKPACYKVLLSTYVCLSFSSEYPLMVVSAAKVDRTFQCKVWKSGCEFCERQGCTRLKGAFLGLDSLPQIFFIDLPSFLNTAHRLHERRPQ